jgi:predicted nucleotidyltransferase
MSNEIKSIEMIDFPETFTGDQIKFITEYVVEKARELLGEKLKGAYLYGSYARGDFKEWSDVDIIILADMEQAECQKKDLILLEMLSEIDYHMNLLLSVIVTPYERFEYFKEDYPFYTNIIKEGVSLC